MAVVIAVYAALVASHEGEFWPFSIYPMFSEAGKPWVRTVAYEVEPALLEQMSWLPQSRSELPGTPFAAQEHGIEVIDLAKYVSMTVRWDDERILGLKKMMGSAAEGRTLVFHKVAGHLVGTGESGGEPKVALSFQPVVALDRGVGRVGRGP